MRGGGAKDVPGLKSSQGKNMSISEKVCGVMGQNLHSDSAIVEVDETNIFDAAKVHSVSWQESHRAFCKTDFVALHTPERQREYLFEKLKNGYKLFMLLDKEPVGVVSVKECLIEDLYVLPEKQNKGYGSALLEFACAKCAGTPTETSQPSRNRSPCAISSGVSSSSVCPAKYRSRRSPPCRQNSAKRRSASFSPSC